MPRMRSEGTSRRVGQVGPFRPRAGRLPRLAIGLGRPGDDDLVFARADASPHPPDNLSRDWHRTVLSLRLPRVSFHALRHSHVSALIAGGSMSSRSAGASVMQTQRSPSRSRRTSSPRRTRMRRRRWRSRRRRVPNGDPETPWAPIGCQFVFRSSGAAHPACARWLPCIRRVDPTHRWRGGRVAEGGGLLNRYTVKSRIVGSNPIPSAILSCWFPPLLPPLPRPQYPSPRSRLIPSRYRELARPRT
jgi:hypothetical protein